MQTLAGRTCMYIGATGGDGIAAVSHLCAGGMNVAMVTHNQAAAEKLVQSVKDAGLPGDCSYYMVDEEAGSEELQQKVFAEIFEKYGSMDVIILNHGDDAKKDDVESMDLEYFETVVDHLIVLSMKTIKYTLPYLKQSKAPRIIMMTTVEGEQGGSYESIANAVGKGGCAALTKACAVRLAPFGITVNAISKGAIWRVGEYAADVPDPKLRESAIPLGRIGTDTDLANAICFLASEESGYITGEMLQLSGGLQLGK